jgi:hypothetical protein
MLDFLFGLGQGLSLVALVSGFVLTIRYRKWVQEVHPSQSRMMETQRLASLGESNQIPVSLIAIDTEHEHREPLAA